MRCAQDSVSLPLGHTVLPWRAYRKVAQPEVDLGFDGNLALSSCHREPGCHGRVAARADDATSVWRVPRESV